MNLKIKKILLKKNKSKIVSLTAYSKSIAKILDKHCDIVLVGDSMVHSFPSSSDLGKECFSWRLYGKCSLWA